MLLSNLFSLLFFQLYVTGFSLSIHVNTHEELLNVKFNQCIILYNIMFNDLLEIHWFIFLHK